MANMKYWLWLSALRGLGNRSKVELLQQYETPERLFYGDDPALQKIDALKDHSMKEVDRILGECDRLGIHFMVYGDAEYPERLMNIYDPPLVLYYKGRMPVFDDEVAIAVVGTRDCTPYGLMAAEDLSYRMTKQGALIVSGLAKGIDAAAHRGALRAGGVTAAVLGCGVDIVYPSENEGLFRDIEASGVILSEYPPGTRPEGRNFPARNRIISGLSLGVLVAEAPLRSGALITAELALEQGKDVYAVPGPIFSPNSAGTNRLIRDGAFLAGDSWDVLREYAQSYPHKLAGQEVGHIRPTLQPEKETAKQKEKPAEMPEKLQEEPKGPVLDLSLDHGFTDDQIHILQILDHEMQVDDIIEATQIPTRRVLSALTLLELEDYVTQSPGKRFSRLVTIKKS